MLNGRTMSDMAGPAVAGCSWRSSGQLWNSRPLRRGVVRFVRGRRICGHSAFDRP